MESRDIEVITIAGLISFLSVELLHSDGKRFIRIGKDKNKKYGFMLGHYNKTKGPTIVNDSSAVLYPTYHSALLAAIRCTKLGW